MNRAKPISKDQQKSSALRFLLLPLKILAWPFTSVWRAFNKHFFAYLFGRALRDQNRVYSVKFIWYGDSVYLHPMVWGSFLLFWARQTTLFQEGWLLLLWFIGLAVCYLTIMYNFDVVRTAILGIGIVALLGVAYFATREFSWNPLSALAHHLTWLEASVSAGFYLVACYLFSALIFAEVTWAWLFHRVEIDESYVYEHRFLQGSTREPIFARGMKRETKDLLELLILGAGDIEHRTKSGVKRFGNVPFASLWLGSSIDSLLDYRRKGEVELRSKQTDEADQVRIQDAMQEEADDWDDDGAADDGGADDDGF